MPEPHSRSKYFEDLQIGRGVWLDATADHQSPFLASLS